MLLGSWVLELKIQSSITYILLSTVYKVNVKRCNFVIKMHPLGWMSSCNQTFGELIEIIPEGDKLQCTRKISLVLKIYSEINHSLSTFTTHFQIDQVSF